MAICLQGCKPTQPTQQDQIAGVESPFYKRTTFTISLVDSNKQWVSQKAENFYQVHLKLFKGLMDGNLSGFRKKALKESYDLQKIRDRARLSGYEKTEGAINNESFRENFLDNIDRKRFIEYEITLKWDWSITSGNHSVMIHSLSPIFKPSAAGVSLGQQPLCSVPYEDAIGFLNTEEKATLFQHIQDKMKNLLNQSEAIAGDLSYQGEKANDQNFYTKRPLPYSNVFDSLQSDKDRFFEQIHLTLYEKALAGDIQGFPNDSLNTAFGDSALKKQGATREVFKYRPDPTDYRYQRDTVVYDHLNPETIKRYRILESWAPNQRKGFQVSTQAMAMAYREERAGVKLPHKDLFWMKMAEIEAALPSSKANWLKKFILLKLQRKLGPTDYSF